MLLVLVGNDTASRKSRLEKIIESHEDSGISIRKFTDANFDIESIKAIANNASLFEQKNVTVISGIGDVPSLRDELENLIPVLAESNSDFILNENNLLTGFLKGVTSSGGKVEKFELEKKEKKSSWDSTFADAFVSRKRSACWSIYRNKIKEGEDPRALHGLLFWAVKSMMTGGYPYGRLAKNFSKEELDHLAVSLAELPHEVMLSGADMEISLEAFILRSLVK